MVYRDKNQSVVKSVADRAQKIESPEVTFGAFSVGASVNDKENYNQLVLNLARHAIDLAIECNYHRSSKGAGEPFNLKEHPDIKRKMQEFQPPLGELESSLFANPNDKNAADALQAILAAMARLLR